MSLHSKLPSTFFSAHFSLQYLVLSTLLTVSVLLVDQMVVNPIGC